MGIVMHAEKCCSLKSRQLPESLKIHNDDDEKASLSSGVWIVYGECRFLLV